MTTPLSNYKDAEPTANASSRAIDGNPTLATNTLSSPHASDIDLSLPKLITGFRGGHYDQLTPSSIENPSGVPIGLLLNNQLNTADQGYLARAPVLPPIGLAFAANTSLDRRASFPLSRAEHISENQDFHRRPLATYKHLQLSPHHGVASSPLHMQHPLLQPHILAQRAPYPTQLIPSLLPLPSLFQAPPMSADIYSAVSNQYVQQQTLPPSFSVPQQPSRYQHCGYQAEVSDDSKFQQDPPWGQDARENRVARRFRRRYNQIERRYACSYPGCTKSYGLLNHLNTHIVTKKHGSRKAKADFQTSYFPQNYSSAPYSAPSMQTEYQAADSPPFSQGNGGYAMLQGNVSGYLNVCGISHGYKNDSQKFNGDEMNATKGIPAWHSVNGMQDPRVGMQDSRGGIQDPRGGMNSVPYQSQANPFQRHSSQQGLLNGNYHGEHTKRPPVHTNFQTYSQINNYAGYHVSPVPPSATSPLVAGHPWQEPRQTLGGNAGSTQGYDSTRST